MAPYSAEDEMASLSPTSSVDGEQQRSTSVPTKHWSMAADGAHMPKNAPERAEIACAWSSLWLFLAQGAPRAAADMPPPSPSRATVSFKRQAYPKSHQKASAQRPPGEEGNPADGTPFLLLPASDGPLPTRGPRGTHSACMR